MIDTPVRREILLTAVVVSQAAILLTMLAILVANRVWHIVHARSRAGHAGRVAAPLRRWLLERGPVGGVAAALRSLPPRRALEQAAAVLSLRIPAEQLAELATAVRGERWVRRTLRRAGSRLWWRRLSAARLLVVVGDARDRAVVRRLLNDPHPAVQMAASACLARVSDAGLVTSLVHDLPDRPASVRLYQFAALRERWQWTESALLRRLSAAAPPRRLVTWVDLAESLDAPRALARAVELHAHPDPEVRTAVARACRKYPHPRSIEVLLLLLADRDWRVRGQAARALGALGALGGEAAVPPLARAMADPAWWVRFRAGLSLALLGEPGRAALRAVRATDDRFGREMAAMISGLSDGGVLELAEG